MAARAVRFEAPLTFSTTLSFELGRLMCELQDLKKTFENCRQYQLLGNECAVNFGRTRAY